MMWKGSENVFNVFLFRLFLSEHVWDVHVQRKGLGESYGILGKYRLCITNTSLSLVRIGSTTNSLNENRVANVEFSLASIRR
jgi:PTB domain (IRS-1 type)